jgi:hypothetical protein
MCENLVSLSQTPCSFRFRLAFRARDLSGSRDGAELDVSKPCCVEVSFLISGNADIEVLPWLEDRIAVGNITICVLQPSFFAAPDDFESL